MTGAARHPVIFAEGQADRLNCYLTATHACGYLPGREAVTMVVDPRVQVDTRLYSALAERGFRRSGAHLYRPRCPACRACIPLRIPTAEFRPSRGQRRVVRRNTDLVVRQQAAEYRDEHFDLYRRYLAARHCGGGMDEPDPEGYLGFLSCRGIATSFYEFLLAGRLLAVAVTDRLDAGLSAVYTYFEPGMPGRGLGVYTILWQIAEARRLGLPWLYLGYWIEGCRKMSYKDRYRPFEIYGDGHWRRGEAGGEAKALSYGAAPGDR